MNHTNHINPLLTCFLVF